MWISPVLSLLSSGCLLILYPAKLAMVWPIIGLWFVFPALAWWISLPLIPREAKLTDKQHHFLRKLSRKTWSFFETFVGDGDNWLPPDNYQEQPVQVIAHRTSPTNMGLSLLANLSAYDFGYIQAGELLERTSKAFNTMNLMEKYQGHFFNWYDTQSLKPLRPLYVSSVDSGNLAGHLLTLKQGLITLPDQIILGPRLFEGINDTLQILIEMAGKPLPEQIVQFRKYLNVILSDHPVNLGYLRKCLEKLTEASAKITNALIADTGIQLKVWANNLSRQCRNALDELYYLTPWIFNPDLPDINANSADIIAIPTLREIAYSDNAKKRIEQIESLIRKSGKFADMEYGFLYDKSRHLQTVGYNVEDRRRDSSYYDLLASEARLSSFVAIAQDQVPQESWFALGRLLTTINGEPILLSWSGSMFEYLMPLIIMPEYENSLLYKTCKEAVLRQIEYGKFRGVPWGISESGYNSVDAQQNYQYRAFGVPGLGLKRGLSEDLVISPYATALALMVMHEEACHNLERLDDEGFMGEYGFYEAIDYTPVRLPRGQSHAVIKSFMAHHERIRLNSLASVLL